MTTVCPIAYSSFVMLTITIDRNLKAPVYEQVANQTRRLIASGLLRPGLVLPSVRQLAVDLGVNLNTIAKAYRLLETEGFLVIRDRAGVAVAAPAAEIEHFARSKLLDQLRTSLARLRQAGMTTEELLTIMRREVLALDGALKEKNDE
ncbi:MAG: GntR family transcriptional regulator [Candidatus Krumholzibacteria bacterium]|nr:GntR family transcriptional regulator [Candidatus Krumholzibacteria bacterium]